MDEPLISFTMAPIGTFECEMSQGGEYKYSVPRQGVFHAGHPGVVRLRARAQFEQAVRDLEGFERIWLVFVFHQNRTWRPTVRPPIPPADHERVGVFASRSPYRPNPIGLSCVRLLKVEGLCLEVDEADLLHGTPILDIKPYIPKADAFPEVRSGWVQNQTPSCWEVQYSAEVLQQAKLLENLGGPDLLAIATIHLRENPLDASRKRVHTIDATHATLSIRMFRIDFTLENKEQKLWITNIRSGYSEEELSPSTPDPYFDKNLHRAYCAQENLRSC